MDEFPKAPSEYVSRAEFDELQKLLNQNLKLSEDNNYILHRMRKVWRIAFAVKVLIWGIVLLVPVLLYPYLEAHVPGIPLLGTATSTNSASSLFGLPSPTEIQNLLHPSK